MSVYLEMTERLRAEIEAAEDHLAKLRTALEGLQPLVTMDVDAREVKKTPRLGLGTGTQKPVDAPLVEEVPAAEQASSEAGETSEPAAPAAPKPKRGRKARGESGLPSTSGHFWTGVMGKRAYTSAEVLERAMKALDGPEEARTALSNRFSAWLYAAIKAGKAEQAGMKGKLKRYKITAATE